MRATNPLLRQAANRRRLLTHSLPSAQTAQDKGKDAMLEILKKIAPGIILLGIGTTVFRSKNNGGDGDFFSSGGPRRKHVIHVERLEDRLEAYKGDLNKAITKKGAGFNTLKKSAATASSAVVAEAKLAKSRTYVINFRGDMFASQNTALREEVSAILHNFRASSNGKAIQDNVIILINSGGGTVTGYGLAAEQLRRLKEAGIKVTVCVDEVAASGGYLMACVADHIAASPFSTIGSIGVLSPQFNVFDLMKKWGISAGKFGFRGPFLYTDDFL